MLIITQKKSTNGGTRKQRQTMLALGLRRPHDSVEREDNPQVRGMINVVSHLVDVKEA
ncbi:MAG: 50S ribosomal protein L30 [Flaviflexus sp.]|nr:50S ribosomal protein L30 [Flaviflexus sp.]